MGRSIASISQRLDAKLAEWKDFIDSLPPNERKAFLGLVREIRNHRTEIDATGEPDISISILLAIVTHLKGEIDALRVSGGQPVGDWLQ